MAAPPPRVFGTELAKLAVSIQPHDPKRCGRPGTNGDAPYYCLACQYRWLYEAAARATVGDSVKTRGPSTSPTEVVVESKVVARAAVERAFRQLKSAITALESIAPTLESGLKRADGGHGPMEKYPPGSTMLSPEEREATFAAAERRRLRGDGFGEG